MSNDFDLDGDIGLGDEDKNKVQGKSNDWYKGEKGRTDRVALVYFNTHEVVTLRKAVKQKPDLSDEAKQDLINKVRQAIAGKLNKTVDQLDPVDLLDISEARFKPVSGTFKKDVGFVAAPKGSLTIEDQKVWSKVGEMKDYVTTLLLIYPTDRDGELDKSALATKWQLKPWRFPPEKYDVIRKINRGLLEDGKSVATVDLSLSCTDAQYQKITITQAGPAIYLRNDQFKHRVLTKAVSMYSKLNPFRSLTTDELREKLNMGGGTSGGGTDYSGEDFSGILGSV